jgi:hypothetical protein
MRVSWALELGCHAPIHLSRLKLREQLVPSECHTSPTPQWPRTFHPKSYDPKSVRA